MIVGSMGLHPVSDDTAWVNTCSVLPEKRTIGLGWNLYDKVLTKAKELKINKLLVVTLDDHSSGL